MSESVKETLQQWQSGSSKKLLIKYIALLALRGMSSARVYRQEDRVKLKQTKEEIET